MKRLEEFLSKLTDLCNEYGYDIVCPDDTDVYPKLEPLGQLKLSGFTVENGLENLFSWHNHSLLTEEQQDSIPY